MRTFELNSTSMLAGAAVAAVAFLAMAQKPTGSASFEYAIHIDVDAKMVGQLAADGWEFVGYLGQSTKGASSDETLWRKPE